ncbi:hypothetical protein OL229_07170 [Neisseriaceae bacterium JH1-16]|nr:hypothetical protein [Neisseriaceae bacterium JH1-16]
MALIAVPIRLSATAWLVAVCLYGPAALAFDARSPFGENGRDDWHSADHNWDGSPVTPLRIAPVTTTITPTPLKPLALVDKAISRANPTPRTAPIIVIAAPLSKVTGTAPPSGQFNNAIALVNTLLNNVAGANLTRELALSSNIIDTSSQVTLSSQGRIYISR